MRIRHLQRVVLLSLGLALAAFGRAGAQATSTSTEGAEFNGRFTSKAGWFSITLPPGYPRPVEETVPLELAGDNGVVNLHSFSSELGNDAAIVFSYSFLGLRIEMVGQEQDLLDGASANVLEEMGAVLEKETDITIGAYPGRVMIFSVPGDGEQIFHGRLHM